MLKRAFDLSVSVLTAVAALAIVWVVVFDGGGRRLPFSKPRVERPPTGYVRGDTMDQLPGVGYRSVDRTLLIVFRSRCSFCVQSVPMYRRLMSERAKRGAHVQIIAVGFEADADARSFPDQQGWQPDSVVFAPPSTIRVKGVPALLLVDSNGKIIESWLGQLDSANYDDIVRTVF